MNSVKRPQHGPVRVAFLAAGFNFAAGSRVRDVPYDPHTPFIFDGEETSLAIRAWTRGYDFYLPTEQIAHWYAPFVAALDLGEAVSTGWDMSTRWWRNDGSECFYHPPGLGCDGEPLSTAGAGPLAAGSWHATGSDARLGEFYTPELARAVSEWAKADLEEFGYPAWDGVDGAGYLRRISAPY